MAHFAQLDDKNIVTRVIVVSNDDITDSNGNEIELAKKLNVYHDAIQKKINKAK